MSSTISFIKPTLKAKELTDQQLEFASDIISKFLVIHDNTGGKYPIGWTSHQLEIVYKRIIIEKKRRWGE